jgi:thiosulfate/3-mercaptopyruvate sulfurtransferase
MAKIVPAQWVAEQLEKSEITIIDPRRPMKYLAGHLPGALNVPAFKLFGADGRLLNSEELAQFIGRAGIGDAAPPLLLYDSPEGQNAAMLAWVLEYLGRNDVHVMAEFAESWKAKGYEILYKPVEAPPLRLTPRINPTIRADLEAVQPSTEVARDESLKLVDFRSREEFTGAQGIGHDPLGHIPGAVNIVWRELGSPSEGILKSHDALEQMLKLAGIRREDDLVAYCRSGLRASLGYLALREMGYRVRLFDGSYAEWSQAGLPVEK